MRGIISFELFFLLFNLCTDKWTEQWFDLLLGLRCNLCSTFLTCLLPRCLLCCVGLSAKSNTGPKTSGWTTVRSSRPSWAFLPSCLEMTQAIKPNSFACYQRPLAAITTLPTMPQCTDRKWRLAILCCTQWGSVWRKCTARCRMQALGCSLPGDRCPKVYL